MNVFFSERSNKVLQSGLFVEQNEPNPFNNSTTIQFSLPYQAKVTIVITNSLGKVVDKLFCNSYEPGFYKLEFSPNGLPKGTYFYHIVADKFCESREMELIK